MFVDKENNHTEARRHKERRLYWAEIWSASSVMMHIKGPRKNYTPAKQHVGQEGVETQSNDTCLLS